MMIKISIIIPCYNHGDYIKDAIQSVEECRNKDIYEIIILNDGSTDKSTIETLQQLSDDGYYVINQHNQGLGAARNNAIKKAKGQYILPLDSDNKICPEYIYESIAILDAQPNIAMVYGDIEYFGNQTGFGYPGEFNLQKLMMENFIDACAVFRKSVWEAVGGYDENMPVMGLEDWDLWLNMSLHGYHFHYIQKVLFNYRFVDNSMLTKIDLNKAMQLRTYLQKKYKKYLDRDYINAVAIRTVQKNKMLIFKFIVATFFPNFLDFLVKKKIVKRHNVLF